MFFRAAVLFALSSIPAWAAVISLTEENFAATVNGDQNVLVEFYAPWCGHCKNLAPEWAIAGDTFQPSDEIVIADVDATAAPELQSRFGVEGFPTIKFFAKGADVSSPEDYNGGRQADEIVQWVNDKVGTSRKVKSAPSSVVTLTTGNFDSFVSSTAEKSVLVEFYAPWCGHCKHLAPEYEKLANAFAGEKNVVIAKVDATEDGDLADRFDVKGYPTVKLFTAVGSASGKQEVSDFNGRDLESMTNLLNEKLGTKRATDGSLKEDAGRVTEADALIVKASGVVDESLVKALTGVTGADLYVSVAKKVVAKGKDYLQSETKRLTQMIDGASVSAVKKTDFMTRRNILNAFINWEL